MISGYIKLDIFEWEVEFMIVGSLGDKKALKYIKKHPLPEEHKQDIYDNINKGFNGGRIFTDSNNRASLMLIYNSTSKVEQLAIVTHETRHICDDLCSALHIEDVETPAYIEEYINKQIFKKLI